MMRRLLIVLFFSGYIIFFAPPVFAEPAIGLQPLQYTETLRKGERKKAFIDVVNPSSQPVIVQFEVQGFKQVDDKGTLSFFSDEKISNGVLLDYQEKEIPAKKTLRLYFVVDGTKLPTGDVFAAIFAQTKSEVAASVPSVRVGTLLMLTNGSPGARHASVEAITTSRLHMGDSIDGEIKIKNTAPVSSASGFFPKVTVATWPFGPKRVITGPLVYAGNTRTIPFKLPSDHLGVYKITATYDSSSKGQWVIVMTGVWRWVVAIAMVSIVSFSLIYKFVYKKPHRKRP